jgi:hypothetical protein
MSFSPVWRVTTKWFLHLKLQQAWKNFVARLVETGIMTELDSNVLAEKVEKEDRETRRRQAEADASGNKQYNGDEQFKKMFL